MKKCKHEDCQLDHCRCGTHDVEHNCAGPNPRKCRGCGEMFTPYFHDSKVEYCCIECYDPEMAAAERAAWDPNP